MTEPHQFPELSIAGSFDFPENFFRSFQDVDITRRNAFWANFLEVCFRPPPPGTCQKLLQNQRTAKGASGKGPHQKSPKSVKNIFDHFSTIFAQGKKRQKSSKSVENIFDTFRQFSRGTSFPAPFRGL